MNMTVVNKKSNELYKVYDIIYDRAGYPHFLIYKDGQWLRLSAKYFRPYKDYFQNSKWNDFKNNKN